MYVSELINDFIEHLEVEGGRSIKTAENYKLYLERFVEFTEDIKVAEITTEHIRQYRLWLNRYENNNDETLATITQSYHLIALRGFLHYLSGRDIASLSPDKIILPKVSRKQVTFLYREEVNRLLSHIDLSSEQGLRDHADQLPVERSADEVRRHEPHAGSQCPLRHPRPGQRRQPDQLPVDDGHRRQRRHPRHLRQRRDQ